LAKTTIKCFCNGHRHRHHHYHRCLPALQFTLVFGRVVVVVVVRYGAAASDVSTAIAMKIIAEQISS